ncbi:phosphopantetheine-binding protein [Rhodospirillum sp. A1_3_36]|uniref:phosphopantetheine-binding protein n=1 Tax=Rhodospirillum sp. A1_3_36 TaxID=3391666 RepID=UPI0039A747CF
MTQPLTSQDFSALIREYCRELLDCDPISDEDLFLELGGNSLMAAMLANRLEDDQRIRPCIEDILVSSIGELSHICVELQSDLE